MSGRALPRVHVLLLNWNGWRDTTECLESVFGSDYPDLRVIVCDNESTDDSLDRIREWAEGRLRPEVGGPPDAARRARAEPVRYVEYSRNEALRGGTPGGDARLILLRTGGNIGFAGGNNVGLRYLLARNEPGYVWVLNNDVVVAPDALRWLVEAAEADPGLGPVGCTLMQYHQPDRLERFAGARVRRWSGMALPAQFGGARREEADPTRLEIDFIAGTAVLTRISTLATVGLIDERYFIYLEDVDWSFRMKQAGLRLGCEPRAVIWHKGGGAMVHRSPRHDYHVVKSSLLFVHRFEPRWLSAAVLYWLWRALLPKLVRRQWVRASAVLRAYRDFVRQVRGGATEPIAF